jgi:tetratricopeptide (TPR) repeat protein
MRSKYNVLAALSFLCAVILRVLLCWSNPVDNAFDDHFKPILMIMASGTIPAKDACWQCYHPPVFYWMSAMAGNTALAMGVTYPQVLKLLQWIPCLYGILTVGIVYLILHKLPLTNFSRLMAFATVCFLPRHIYMSAMNSNDSISYFFVALSIYLLIIAVERKLSPVILVAVSIVTSITLFTKYTAYVVLPMILVVFASLFYKPFIASRKRVLGSFLLVALLPILLLSVYFVSNTKQYDSPLPWNVNRLDPSLTQPRDDDRLDFVSFKPWESILTPMVVPGKMHSFWTLVYSGMWFDNEPKFLDFLDSNREWWRQYYSWQRGEEKFPGENPSMSDLTKSIGSGLIAFGLVPLLFFLIGSYHFLRGNWKRWTKTESLDAIKMNMFPALLFSNAAGVIALAVRLPVYSSAKASYILNSLPAFAVFLSLGLIPCEKNRNMKWAVVTAFCILFALASLHILQIHEAQRTRPTYQDAAVNAEKAPMQPAVTKKAAPEKIVIPPADPNTAEGQLRMGLSLSQEGKTDEAIRKFEEALRLNPNLVAAHVSLGLIMVQKRDLDKAIHHFRKALEIKPDLAEVHNSLGVALIYKGDLDEAVEHLETAIKINPKFAKAHNSLAVALAKKGRTEEAIRHLKKAVELQPDYEEAQRNLKIMLEMQGKLS